jgi:hypothetical protein
VDPFPDPLLLRKSSRAGNRTRNLWILKLSQILTNSMKDTHLEKQITIANADKKLPVSSLPVQLPALERVLSQINPVYSFTPYLRPLLTPSYHL